MNLNRYRNSVWVAALGALVWLAGSAAFADNLKPAPWQDLVNPHPFPTYSGPEKGTGVIFMDAAF